MGEETQSGHRVLVVDDDPDIREILVRNLEQIGCVTCEAADGLEAIDQLKAFQPEVMVLDVNMPFLDGFGVLARMRELSLGQDVRTLMLTARNDRDDVQRSIALGARDYLAKPFSGKQFALRIARLLIRSRSQLDR